MLAYFEEFEELVIDLMAVADYREDFSLDLEAVEGTERVDFSLDLYVTDGVVTADFTMDLRAINKVPVFKATVALRLTSVTSEV